MHGFPPGYFLKRLIFLLKVSCRNTSWKGSRSRDRYPIQPGDEGKRAIISDKSGRIVSDIRLIATIAMVGCVAGFSVMRSDQSKNAARMLHLALHWIK
jgi:hypothetical protein